MLFNGHGQWEVELVAISLVQRLEVGELLGRELVEADAASIVALAPKLGCARIKLNCRSLGSARITVARAIAALSI